MTAADDDKKRRLEFAVDAIQTRCGHLAIRHLRPQKREVPHVSTGFPALDAALGIGGLPRGYITELVSVPSSGTTTIALHVIAQAQAAGLAIYLDIEQNFDPPYAAQLGVDLEQLILIEPKSWREACSILRDFILEGNISILVFDAPIHMLREPRYARALSTTLDRIASPLTKTACILLLLITWTPDSPHPTATQVIQSALANHAAIRLVVYRIRWLYAKRDIGGYEANVYIARNKFAATSAEPRPVHLTIALAGEEEETGR